MVTPLVEDLLKVGDHLSRWLLGSVSGVLLPSWVEMLEGDVGLHALESFSEFACELVEDRVELFSLLHLAVAPFVISVNHGLEDSVDDSVQ